MDRTNRIIYYRLGLFILYKISPKGWRLNWDTNVLLIAEANWIRVQDYRDVVWCPEFSEYVFACIYHFIINMSRDYDVGSQRG